ncbi:MAG: hypothetical protein J5631_12645 [Spirochaetaceae bacterium]|nr:hypothetical protein [Spirochaetaceae bacterium]
MIKNYYYIYIAAALSIIIPFPPRFAYGIVAILLLNLLIYGGFGIKVFAEKFNLQPMLTSMLVFSIIALTGIYKQLLILYAPSIAFTSGLALYLTAFSSYIYGNVLDTVGLSPVEHIIRTSKRTGLFSGLVLLFFLLRDILAFGSITLPAPKGIKVITLFKVGEVYPLHFLATIPGTLIVLGLIFALFSYINRKLMILRRVSK